MMSQDGIGVTTPFLKAYGAEVKSRLVDNYSTRVKIPQIFT